MCNFDRNGFWVKASMSVLLLGMAAFMTTMSVLIVHDSSLICTQEGNCVHVENYPLGIIKQTRLPRISSVNTQWDPGGRVMAIKLVLAHEDGTLTEYRGVGKNGERAQAVAAKLNAFIEQPRGKAEFPLREGSVAASVFLLLLGLLALLCLPYFFSKVRLRVLDEELVVRVERWPVPPRLIRVSLPRVRGFDVRHLVMPLEQHFYQVGLLVDGVPVPIDLGMAFRTVAQAQERVACLNAWLTS